MATQGRLPEGTWRVRHADSAVAVGAALLAGYDAVLAVPDSGTGGMLACSHAHGSFASTEVCRTADRLEVDGLLTVRGRTLPITAAGSVAETDAARTLTLVLTTVIDPRQFGDAPSPLGTPVHVRAQLVLQRTA